MKENSDDKKPATGVKLIFTAAFVLLGFWFAYEIISIIFLFFFAVVLTLILNAPAMWLISKKVPRTVAALIVFFAMLLFLSFLGWLVVPRILEQVTTLAANLPGYISDLHSQLASLLKDYPSLQKELTDKKNLQDNLPDLSAIISSLSRISISLIGGIFLLIIFFSVVIYMLINPAPLIESYLLLFPKEKRAKAAQALSEASVMMVGWMWSNLLVGIMEAIAVYFFLSFMGVPGVWVWVGLALFAEMVPKLGLYIMAIPPVLIALSIDPVTALWVLIFYLALNEIMSDFVMPRIRASTMNLHPVSTLFTMLALASAFGLVGALIATPLTAFFKAYYEAFYLSSTSKENIKDYIQAVLSRERDITNEN